MVTASTRLVGVAELMDSPNADPGELGRMLRDLAWINRFLGGYRVIRTQLAPQLLPVSRPARILDVGTGLADIPRALVRWARERDLPVQVAAVDRHGRVVGLARRTCAGYPEVHVQRADALALPFPDASFDVVLASLLLHRMERDEPVRLLRELNRVARRAVIVNDSPHPPLLAGTSWTGVRSRRGADRHAPADALRQAASTTRWSVPADKACAWHQPGPLPP
jgi:SAM-dependent methyltransferase